MSELFELRFTNHEKAVRGMLLQSKQVTPEQLAVMTNADLEDFVRKNYKAFSMNNGEDWMLVPNEKYNEFSNLVKWVCR